MLKTRNNIITVCLLTVFLTMVVSSSLSFSQDNRFRDTTQYKNIAKGKTYTFSTAPNYALCSDAGDIVQLTDGIYTAGYFWTQKSTVGWQGKRPIIITIDLGKVEPIRGLSFNTAAGVADVTWPVSVYVLVSNDDIKYYAIDDLIAGSNKRDSPPAKAYAIHRYWIDNLQTHGRYVQLLIEPGGPFCFVDEVEIYRGEDSWITQQIMGVPTRGGLDFFQAKATNNSIKSRLYSDLNETRVDIKRSGLGVRETAHLFAELNEIEVMIPKLPAVDPKAFLAIFPINELQSRIFSIRAEMRRLKSLPQIDAWVSHPLDYITPTQKSDSTSRKYLEVAMMCGEWRSAVLNLTNSGSLPKQIQFSIQGLPVGNRPKEISVYEVQWTDTRELKPIGAALKELQKIKSGYATIIPSGMTRQIWFTFHPVNMVPGTHKGRIMITEGGGRKYEIPLTLRLFPIAFPERPTLHVGGWDYTDSDAIYGVTFTNRDAFISHLQERFVDSPWATSRVMPFSSFDPRGNFVKKPDTSRFDAWIAQWPKARRYCIFLNVGDSLAGSKTGSDTFAAKVKSWIDFWVAHAIKKNIKSEQLVLLLVDEPSKNDQDQIIIEWAKAIHAAQPKVTVWEDPIYQKPEKALPKMMSSVDVLCPYRVQMLSEGKHFKDFYRKQKADGRRLDFYSCSGPMHLLDPYAYVRLQAWTCWDMGAESTFFWAFGDTGGGNPWNPYATPGTNYAPMFLSPDSVTPGKHMEALRESVEDFEYFVMLKDAVAKAAPGNPSIPKAKDLLQSCACRVLDAENANKLNWTDDKDRWIAEEVRLEILETLMALKYSGSNQVPQQELEKVIHPK